MNCTHGRHCDAGNPAQADDHFAIRTAPSSGFSPPPEDQEIPAGQEAPLSRWVTASGAIELRSRVCFLPMVTQETEELVRLNAFWQQRLMPFAGGLLDQPNGFLRAMEVIDRRFALLKRDK